MAQQKVLAVLEASGSQRDAAQGAGVSTLSTTTVVLACTAVTQIQQDRQPARRGAALDTEGAIQQQRRRATVLVRGMLDVGCQDMLDTARRLRAARGWRPRLVLADLSVVEQRYRAVLAVQCAVV